MACVTSVTSGLGIFHRAPVRQESLAAVRRGRALDRPRPEITHSLAKDENSSFSPCLLHRPCGATFPYTFPRHPQPSPTIPSRPNDRLLPPTSEPDDLACIGVSTFILLITPPQENYLGSLGRAATANTS